MRSFSIVMYHADIIDFLTNVECVEGRFDTYGTQGRDFTSHLLGGGPTSKGFAKANLSPRTRALLEEVALSEQVCPAAHMQHCTIVYIHTQSCIPMQFHY